MILIAIPKHAVTYYSKEAGSEFQPKLIIIFDVTGIINNTVHINWNKSTDFIMYDLKGKQVNGSINSGLYIKVHKGTNQKVMTFDKNLYKY